MIPPIDPTIPPVTADCDCCDPDCPPVSGDACLWLLEDGRWLRRRTQPVYGQDTREPVTGDWRVVDGVASPCGKSLVFYTAVLDAPIRNGGTTLVPAGKFTSTEVDPAGVSGIQHIGDGFYVRYGFQTVTGGIKLYCSFDLGSPLNKSVTYETDGPVSTLLTNVPDRVTCELTDADGLTDLPSTVDLCTGHIDGDITPQHFAGWMYCVIFEPGATTSTTWWGYSYTGLHRAPVDSNGRMTFPIGYDLARGSGPNLYRWDGPPGLLCYRDGSATLDVTGSFLDGVVTVDGPGEMTPLWCLSDPGPLCYESYYIKVAVPSTSVPADLWIDFPVTHEGESKTLSFCGPLGVRYWGTTSFGDNLQYGYLTSPSFSTFYRSRPTC